jgi:hypothetical protein
LVWKPLMLNSPSHAASSVFVFYLAVVLEEGDIHHRGLDPQDQPELVVHLDRHRPHGVLDARSLNARIEPVTHLILVVAVQFPAQESGDVVRFHRVDGGPRQPLIDGLQVALALKHDVGGELDLIQASSGS